MTHQELQILLTPEKMNSSIPDLLEKIRYGAYIPRNFNSGAEIYNECLRQVQLIKFLRNDANVPGIVKDYAKDVKFEHNYDEYLIQFDVHSDMKTSIALENYDSNNSWYTYDKLDYVEQKINHWFANNYLLSNFIYGELYNYTKALKLSIKTESYDGSMAFEGTYVPDKDRFLSYLKEYLFARLHEFSRPDYEYRTKLGLSVELDSESFNIEAFYSAKVQQDNQGHIPALKVSMLYNLNPWQLLTFKTYAGDKIRTL